MGKASRPCEISHDNSDELLSKRPTHIRGMTKASPSCASIRALSFARFSQISDHNIGIETVSHWYAISRESVDGFSSQKVCRKIDTETAFLACVSVHD